MKSTDDIIRSYGRLYLSGHGLYYARLISTTGVISMRVGDTAEQASTNLMDLVYDMLMKECDIS